MQQFQKQTVQVYQSYPFCQHNPTAKIDDFLSWKTIVTDRIGEICLMQTVCWFCTEECIGESQKDPYSTNEEVFRTAPVFFSQHN